MSNEEALKILGVTLPVTKAILKSAFRRRSHETHPDLNKDDPNAAEKFIKVKAAFDLISSQETLLIDVSDVESEAFTTDGDKLSDLGQGLPHTKAGVPCPDCSGRGWHERQVGLHWVPCPSCGGDWRKRESCRKCNGSGKFKRNGVVVGDCYACKGRGHFVRICRDCNPKNKDGLFQKALSGLPLEEQLYIMRVKLGPRGRSIGGFWFGYGDTPEGKIPSYNKIYHTCFKCKGCGEVELFNPVLRRNLL